MELKMKMWTQTTWGRDEDQYRADDTGQTWGHGMYMGM